MFVLSKLADKNLRSPHHGNFTLGYEFFLSGLFCFFLPCCNALLLKGIIRDFSVEVGLPSNVLESPETRKFLRSATWLRNTSKDI